MVCVLLENQPYQSKASCSHSYIRFVALALIVMFIANNNRPLFNNTDLR